MKTITNVKKDLEFTRGLSSLIEALKNIAVSQYRALEHKIKAFDKFFICVESFFNFIDPAKVAHAFIVPKNKSQIVLAVTSDSGLLGGLNMQVVNAAISELEKIPGRLVVVGERGKMYAQDSGVAFTAFGGIKDEERLEQALQLRDYLVNRFLKDSAGYLKVVYPRPVSFTVQRIEVVAFMPFSPDTLGKSKREVVTADIIFESRSEDIIEYLIYLWMGQKIYEILGLSRLAEFAARYVHLEESLHKLKDMDTKLKLEYFRIRHEIIDRNMRELFSARLMYAG